MLAEDVKIQTKLVLEVQVPRWTNSYWQFLTEIIKPAECVALQKVNQTLHYHCTLVFDLCSHSFSSLTAQPMLLLRMLMTTTTITNWLIPLCLSCVYLSVIIPQLSSESKETHKHAQYCWRVTTPVHCDAVRWCTDPCWLALYEQEQQASWHLSEGGLAYQTTGKAPHVSWWRALSHGVAVPETRPASLGAAAEMRAN